MHGLSFYTIFYIKKTGCVKKVFGKSKGGKI